MPAISTLKINSCRLYFEKQIKFIKKRINKQQNTVQYAQPNTTYTSRLEQQCEKLSNDKQVLISWFDFDILPDVYTLA